MKLVLLRITTLVCERKLGLKTIGCIFGEGGLGTKKVNKKGCFMGKLETNQE